MSKIESLNKLQTWLDKYLNFEKTPQKNIFWLDTMNFFCEKFNHPENSAPSFHVAGSKGKGSVSAFIASILNEAGFETGLYTSPHILDFSERIGTVRGVFNTEVYDSAVEELINGIEKISIDELPGKRPITWFELVTLFGFLSFRAAKTDFNVFEVGLGGRLDATNVITPEISCVTQIELEHTDFLGDTVEKIAAEKGGIIKENKPSLVSEQIPSVKNVFKKIAEERNSKIYFVDDLIENMEVNFKKLSNSNKNNTLLTDKCIQNITSSQRKLMHIKFSSKLFSRPIETELQLYGEFQAKNAAQAALAVKIVRPDITEEQIERGLSKATLPGRFEITRTEKYDNIPFLILDGAHTVNSINFTMQTYEAIFGNEKPALLFGCAADKDSDDIAPLFSGKVTSIFLTKPGLVKISDLEKISESFFKAKLKAESDEDFILQIRKSLKTASEQKAPLLVTGSFYLVSEVKKYLGL